MSNDEIDTGYLCGSQWRSQKGGCDVSWTVIEADGNGVRETCRGGTVTGGTEPEPQPKPKLVTWRRCTPVEHSLWIESGQIPAGWVALEANTQPIETVQQLPEGQKP
jgi:hypothetical protein